MFPTLEEGMSVGQYGPQPDLEGTVTSIDQSAEPADIAWGQVLFGLLLLVDLAIIGINVLFSFLIILFLLLIVSAFLRINRVVWSILTFIAQPFLLLLGGLLRAITGSLFGPRVELPVYHYRVDPLLNHGAAKFRLKGRLANATIQLGDRVRVWGV